MIQEEIFQGRPARSQWRFDLPSLTAMSRISGKLRQSSPFFNVWSWIRTLAAGACMFTLSAAFARYQESFASLVENSPFGREPKDVPPAQPSSTVEFRGFVVEDSETLVGITVTLPGGKPRSAWLNIGGSAYNVHVVGFDPATETASISIEGRPMQLTLKKACIKLLAETSVPPDSVGVSEAAPPMSVGLSNDDRQRVHEVVQEIQRRRNQRQTTRK